MSRTLSKILVICALVVILPLTIVGTAFAAYYSVDAVVNITIQIVGETAAEGSTTALAGVRYNGKDMEENFVVKRSHLDTVTLQAVGVGYDFLGWYEGTAESDAEELIADGESIGEGSAELTFDMKAEKSYVAVFQVVKYKVAWHYVTTPDNGLDQDVQSVEPNGVASSTTYVYGAELPTLSEDGVTGYYGHKNGAWCMYNVDGGIDKTAHYARAEFNVAPEERENITLTYDWVKQGVVRVNYYNYADRTNPSRVALAVDEVTKATANEYNYATSFAAKSIEAEAGYHWTTFHRYNGRDLATVEAEDLSKSEVGESVDIFVNRDYVTYKASITASEAAEEYTGANNIEFKVNEVQNAQTLFADFFNEDKYEKVYSFYELQGIKVGSGSLIESTNANALSTALTSFINEHKNETATLEFTASFRTEFTISVTDNVKFSSTDEAHLDNNPEVYTEQKTQLQEKNLSAAVATTKTLEEYFELKEIGNLYDSNGDGRQEVQFWAVKVNDETITGLTLSSTINDLIEKVQGTLKAQDGKFTVQSLEVVFEIKPAE